MEFDLTEFLLAECNSKLIFFRKEHFKNIKSAHFDLSCGKKHIQMQSSAIQNAKQQRPIVKKQKTNSS